MIVGDILGEHSPHVRWAEDDHVIQTLAAQGSNQSLRIRILPRAGRARDNLADAQAGHPAAEHVSINRITISQQPSCRGVIRKGFNDLLRGPCSRGMFRDREVNDPATLMGEQHEHEQHAAGECRHREEIH
jgi:hypothetical protein